MLQALIVGSIRDTFSYLAYVFAENDVEISQAESGSQTLSMVAEHPFDIIIAEESLPDMQGLELSKKLITKNPLLNIALTSALSSGNFHEASEGLGILMQLPPVPQRSDAEKLLKHLHSILNMTKKK
jgi:CheY-like chemotaxis protein